jgi:hypothetical protein
VPEGDGWTRWGEPTVQATVIWAAWPINPDVRAARAYLLIFVLFAIPMVVIIGVTIGVVRASATDGVVSGLVGGGICGALVALSLGALDLIGDRGRRRGEAYGPRQGATVSVPAGDDVPYRIQAALRELSAEIRDADVTAGRYTARTRPSWRSFGEDVTVHLTGDSTAPVAHIISRPVIRTTLIDYGKGRRNVQQVAARLQSPSSSYGRRES